MNKEKICVEFKVGDKVRIKDTENVRHFSEYNNTENPTGKILTLDKCDIKDIEDNSNCFILFSNKYCCNFELEDLELVEEKEVIIRCPTKELWDKVMEKENNTGSNFWDDYKEKSCLRIKDGKFKGFGNVEYYQEQYQENPIISAGEYLGDTLTKKDIQGAVGTLNGYKYDSVVFDDVNHCVPWVETYSGTLTNDTLSGKWKLISSFTDGISTQKLNKPKQKFMQTLTNTLKKILPSDIQKQYRAGLRNGDLALTGQGNFELLELLADTFKKELTDRAIEIIKEEEKSK